MKTFLAKASTDIIQINERLTKLPELEIQLMDKDLENLTFKHEDFVKVVHVPNSIANIEETNINKLCNFLDYYKPQGELIVFHTENILHDPKELEQNIERLLKYDISIGIENTVLYNRFKKSFMNGALFENIEMAKKYKKIFGNRVGTVLDTCHAEMTIWLLNKLNYLGLPELTIPTMEDYFRENAPLIKLVHLSSKNPLTAGYKNEHGIPFTDLELLKEEMELFEKYKFKCPITLELCEEDYNNSVYLSKTIEDLKMLKEIN